MPKAKVDPLAPALSKLRPKERRFVKNYAKSGNGARAIIEAGYNVSTIKDASNMANTYVKKERIATALDQYMDKLYPDHEQDVATILGSMIAQAKGEAATLDDKIKVVTLMAKLKGWEKPKRVETLSADLTKMFTPPKG